MTEIPNVTGLFARFDLTEVELFTIMFREIIGQ